ncbi:MAG TPA: DUF2239 family protein [Holophaga sp.]|nr:DUF2239 family protein [Holophaga sp.]
MPGASIPMCTAFAGVRRIASGPLRDVALAVKTRLEEEPESSVLVFSDETGEVVDLDLRGAPAEILARLQPGSSDRGMQEETRGRGRPKLGVVAREVTLLPRHWDWLGAQPGGASVTLRRLVEEAKKADGAKASRRASQARAYRFMSAMAGDEPGYEEALRALYAPDRPAFIAHTRPWPEEIRDYARRLAEGAFTPEGMDERAI